MARRPRLFAPGLLYHVIVRGNQRQKTFITAHDYHTYLERLATYRQRYEVVLYAYCLMPNHIHLLVQTAVEPLSKFMQGLQQSYTQYFNRTHRKAGPLFQGRYKALVCEKDRYLLALIRYIHLNPVRAKLVTRPQEYPYSGHQAYLRGKATEALDPARGLALCGGREAYRRFVLAGVTEGHKEEYYEVIDQRFLGTKSFGQRLQMIKPGTSLQRKKGTVRSMLRPLAAQLKVSPAVLKGADRSWTVSARRTLVAYVLVRRCGFGVSEVAAALGRNVATVSALLSRFATRVRQDLGIRREVERLAKIVEK
jgi:putative transposase